MQGVPPDPGEGGVEPSARGGGGQCRESLCSPSWGRRCGWDPMEGAGRCPGRVSASFEGFLETGLWVGLFVCWLQGFFYICLENLAKKKSKLVPCSCTCAVGCPESGRG